MKLRHLTLLLTTFVCLSAAQSSFAFTAVTNPATINTPNTVGGPGADPGDTFNVPNGTFAAYLPGAGDPTITGGDLGSYHFTLSGTVQTVVNNVVSYSGTYEIFYDLDGSNSLTGSDIDVSSGTLSLTVDFNSLTGIYAANGNLHQTNVTPAPFTGFANPDATFAGTYTPTSAAQGLIQGTIQSTSVPDTGNTLTLLGLATLSAFALKRRVLA